ncbi:MAG: trypsin-like peptidase domain-containing protein, partial [Methylocella sp.]
MCDATIISANLRQRFSTAVALAIVLGLALSAVACTSIGGDSSALPWNAGKVTMTSFAPLVSEIIPAVVNVSALQRPGKAAADESPPIGVSPVNSRDTASELTSSALDELLRRFFDDQQHRVAPKTPGLALGSGFIIDPNGYVVTDYHVLENADSITVTLHDATQHQARIVGRDALTDLALLKV